MIRCHKKAWVYILDSLKEQEETTDELYNIVHEEIMKARIKISKLDIDIVGKKQVDDILSDLCMSAPKKAIDHIKEGL